MTRQVIAFMTLILISAAQAEEPVLTVDTDRIISLARQAIADQDDALDATTLEFTDITYRCDAKDKENLRIGFRHSPKSESETTKRGNRDFMKTITKFKAVIVSMDKTGKILSVDSSGTSSQITSKAIKKETVQPSIAH